MPVQTLRLAQPPFNARKTMKKQLLTLALLAVAGTAGAQQLPNVGFDKWKGEGNCGQSYNPADKPTDRTRPGDEPAEWCGSNVFQLGQASTSTLCVKQTEGNNFYAELKNQEVGVDILGHSIKSNAPGFLSLAKPWVFATMGMTDPTTMALGDGGVYGSVNFSNKPDAIRLKYRRAAVNSEKAHVIVYLWNGTFKSKVPKAFKNTGSVFNKKYSISEYVELEDVDRAVFGRENETLVTSKGTLVASVDYEITSDVADWQTVEIPLKYANAGLTPSKMNVVISASDYWTRSNIQLNSKLDVDDVQFVYYNTLQSLKVNGQDIVLKDGVYTYKGIGSIKNGCVEATAKSQFATVGYTYNKDNVIVRVTANDGSTKDYTIQFPSADKIASTYKNEIDVDFQGETTYSFNDVIISANDDNTVDFSLKNFNFQGISVGDVKVVSVPISWSGDNVVLSSKQNITIEGPATETLNLKNMPLQLNAQVSPSNVLTANLQITWNGNTPIGVSVKERPFEYAENSGIFAITSGNIDDESVLVLYGLAKDKATSIDFSKANVTTSMLPDMSEGMPNVIFYLADGTTITGKNIVSNKNTDALVLTDKNAFNVPTDFTAAAVNYDRVFKKDANYVQSFVLPFGFTVPTGTTVAELSSVNGDNLVFKPVAETEANKPYLVVTSDGEFINKLTNVQVKATTGADLTTTVAGVSHIGSYTAQNVENVYGYANGKFVKANTGSVKPFRTYVKVNGAQAAPMAFGVNIEGTVTGINNATAAATAKEAIYNLQGVRVSGDLKHLTKGVYIVNGQKVVVK